MIEDRHVLQVLCHKCTQRNAEDCLDGYRYWTLCDFPYVSIAIVLLVSCLGTVLSPHQSCFLVDRSILVSKGSHSNHDDDDK